MEPDIDFTDEEMKAAAAKQTQTPASPAKEIDSPVAGDQDFTPSQMQSYAIQQLQGEPAIPKSAEQRAKDINKDLDAFFDWALSSKDMLAHGKRGIDSAMMSNEVAIAAWGGADEKTIRDLIEKYEPRDGSLPQRDYTQFGKFMAPIAEMVGPLGSSLITGAGAATGGATIGASIGVFGGPAGGLTVPAGAAAGGAIGFRTGMIVDAGKLEYGNMLAYLLKENIPYDTAKNYALVGGIINAALAKFGVGALVKQATAGFAKQTLKVAAKEYFKNTGIVAADNFIQSVVDLSAKVIAKAQYNQKVTPEQVMVDLSEVFWNSVKTAPVMVAGAGAAGKVAGKFSEYYQAKTPADAVKVANAALLAPDPAAAPAAAPDPAAAPAAAPAAKPAQPAPAAAPAKTLKGGVSIDAVSFEDAMAYVGGLERKYRKALTDLDPPEEIQARKEKFKEAQDALRKREGYHRFMKERRASAINDVSVARKNLKQASTELADAIKAGAKKQKLKSLIEVVKEAKKVVNEAQKKSGAARRLKRREVLKKTQADLKEAAAATKEAQSKVEAKNQRLKEAGNELKEQKKNYKPSDELQEEPLTKEAFEENFRNGNIWMPTKVLRDKSLMTDDVNIRDRKLVKDGIAYKSGPAAGPHSNIDNLKQQIKSGIKNPIALNVDKSGKLNIVDGTHRLLAAEELQMEMVPVQFVPNAVDNGAGYKFAIQHGAKLPIDSARVARTQAEIIEASNKYNAAVELWANLDAEAKAQKFESEYLYEQLTEDAAAAIEAKWELESTTDHFKEQARARDAAQRPGEPERVSSPRLEDSEKNALAWLKKDHEKAVAKFKSTQVELKLSEQKAKYAAESFDMQTQAVKALEARVERAEAAFDKVINLKQKKAPDAEKQRIAAKQQEIRQLKIELRKLKQELLAATSLERVLKAAATKQRSRAVKEAKAYMKRVLSRIAPKGGKSKFSGDVQDELNIYKRLIGITAEQRAEVLNSHIQLLGELVQKHNGDVNAAMRDPKYKQSLEVANITREVDAAFASEDPGAVRDLAEKIQNEIMAPDALSMKERLKAQAKAAKDKANEISIAVRGHGKGRPQPYAGAKPKSEIRKFLERIGTGKHTTANVYQQLQRLMQKSKNATAIIESLGISKAVKRSEEQIHSWYDKFENTLNDKLKTNTKGRIRVLDKLNRPAKDLVYDPRELEHIDAYGKAHAYIETFGERDKVTIGQLIDAHIRMKDADLKAGLSNFEVNENGHKIGNNFTFRDTKLIDEHGNETGAVAGELSTEAMLDRVLSNNKLNIDFRAVGDAIIQTHDQFAPGFLGKVKELFGVAPPAVKNYGGKVMRANTPAEFREGTLETELTRAFTNQKFVAGPTGATIERVPNSNGVLLGNPVMRIYTDLARNIEFMELNQKSSEIDALFGTTKKTSNEVARAIEDTYGKEALAGIRDAFMNVFKGAGHRAQFNYELGDKLMRGAGLVYLAGRPASLLKQSTGIINWAHITPVNELTAGIREFMKDPQGNIKMLNEKSSELRIRYKDLLSQQIGATQELTNARRSELAAAAMWFMETGDKAATYPGFFAKYIYEKRTLMAGGMDEAKADAEAIHRAEEGLVMQAAKRRDLAPNFTTAPVTKYFGFAMKQPMYMTMKEVIAWGDVANHGPGEGRAVNLIRTIAINRASIAAFVGAEALAKTGLGALTGAYTDEDINNAWMRMFRYLIFPASPWESAPLIGGGLTAITNVWSNMATKQMEEAGLPIKATSDQPFATHDVITGPIWSTAQLSMRVIKQIEKESHNEGNIEDYFYIASDYTRSALNILTTRVPAGATVDFAKKYFENAPEDSTVKQMVKGWESQLRKRGAN